MPTPWGHLVSVTLLLPLIISIITSFTQILKGMLEGASHILPALRVLSSLLSGCSDSVPLYSFCREAGLPGLLLSLLRYSQEGNSIRQVSTTQQPWRLPQASSWISLLQTATTIWPSCLLVSFLCFLVSSPGITNSNASWSQADVRQWSRLCGSMRLVGNIINWRSCARSKWDIPSSAPAYYCHVGIQARCC